MMATKPVMKMPELLVFVRALATGFVSAEFFRSAFYLGANFVPTLSDVSLWVRSAGILAGLLLCLAYAFKRGVHVTAVRVGRSLRLDLLVALSIGIWINELVAPSLAKAHTVLKDVDPRWAPAVFIFLCVVLLSPLLQQYIFRRKRTITQLNFLGDEEIGDEEEDLLASTAQAKSFAETVLASSAHSGLVFGVDGPWGVGKTSFINLAERYWKKAGDRAIVCRFEPLRYASEPDLADRLIRDVSSAIQRKVFAPEFRPTASRYSRLIKGKAEVSFLGFKVSLEPSQEAADVLLDDIDEVLRRIGCRVIVVIDDLDRLDAKSIDNVLFATRRTFKLSQASYVLCYDTEILSGSKEDASRAREFLEKFVTVKLSLFVDSSSIRDFLRRDWKRADNQLGSIPSDRMLKLGAVLNELADILDSDLAANYLPLVGDLRKVKRFVNAMLIMQIEKSDLDRTDFNKRDLINLMLLHFNYPGLFRKIYAEETEGRQGTFSVYREYENSKFKFTNSAAFLALVSDQQGAAGFLLTQLFDVQTLDLNDRSQVDEAFLASRACFNEDSLRNLERYLKHIVRFVTPEPQETFVLYQKAVEQVQTGMSIASVLVWPDFSGDGWERAHDQFWRVLINQSYDFNRAVADDAIDTLVEYLPRYSVIDGDDRGLRQRSIYSLLILLDRAGWGRTSGRRLPNTTENVIEIAWRIFGEHGYKGKGLLDRLSSSNRGVLGWHDLMLFRLSCCEDRQGQLHNLYSALIVDQDRSTPTSGPVSNLTVMEMRKLSQEIFALFKLTYIDSQRNFFSEVMDVPVDDFLGAASSQFNQQDSKDDESNRSDTALTQRVSMARSVVKSFVIYQLSNKQPPNGSGVGCGYYDERGGGDHGGIARLMNEYAFSVCFNPNIQEDNIFHFLDYCLSHLSSSFFSDRNDNGYFASKAQLPGGLDPKEMGRYWSQYNELIRRRTLQIHEREVVTPNYIASYREDLPGVFAALDELANEAIPIETDAKGS